MRSKMQIHHLNGALFLLTPSWWKWREYYENGAASPTHSPTQNAIGMWLLNQRVLKAEIKWY